MNLRIAALSLGAFAIGVTEFSPMGLLPDIAGSLDVSIPKAGMLVSAYAFGVMLGAPLITLALTPWSRRTALIALMALFTVGNLLCALAPGYDTLLAARLLISLSHGAFFGLGAMVAAGSVPKERRASAVASMFMGLTIANIGGVPAATWLGHVIGWRTAFLATSGIGVAVMAALALALPREAAHARPHVGRELRVLVRPAVLNALLTTVMGAGSMFTLYTYVAPVLRDITHATPGFVTAMLVVIGLGFTIGNALSGRLADRSVNGTLIGFLVLLALVSAAFPWLAQSHAGAVIALLVWGAATFGVTTPVQMRVMGQAHDAPALASSVNIGAFNMGNALGAAIGGGVLSMGLGYAWIAPIGGLLALGGVALVLIPTQSPPAARQADAA